MTDSSVILENISLNRGNRAVFSGLSFQFLSGESYVIHGNNGAGKTTLLELIAGRLTANQGKVLRNCKQGSIGFLSQTQNLDTSIPISLEEMVGVAYPKESLFSSLFGGRQSRERESLIYESLHNFSLCHLRNHFVSELSRGQLQKALLARLALQDPEIILLDEPFNFLDLESQRILLRLISKWKENGKLIITISHDLNQYKNVYSRRLFLENGKLIEEKDLSQKTKFTENFELHVPLSH